MWIYVVFAVVVAVPIALLLWSRRKRVAGDPKQDSLGNRTIEEPRPGNWPMGGGH